MIRSTYRAERLRHPGASQSDQFLDDGIDRLKPGKAAFCDNAVANTDGERKFLEPD
jgi:hypothetical protein